MKRTAFATLCLLLALLFAGLGAWQVERRTWKLDLIAKVDARVHAAPQAPPARWSDDLAYTRVRASGTYLQDREALVQAVTDYGPGWWVITPLRTQTGTVLVNRGFVPDKATPRHVPGPVTITGLARASEPGGAFLRHNDPAANRWYSRDVSAIAQARGLGAIAPYFIDAEASGKGFPIGGLTVTTFRNAHLQYALTWFALAALSLFGLWRVMRRG